MAGGPGLQFVFHVVQVLLTRPAVLVGKRPERVEPAGPVVIPTGPVHWVGLERSLVDGDRLDQSLLKVGPRKPPSLEQCDRGAEDPGLPRRIEHEFTIDPRGSGGPIGRQQHRF